MLSHEVAKKYGHAKLEQDTINIQSKEQLTELALPCKRCHFRRG